MLSMIVTRTSESTARYRITHHVHDTHPSRSFTVGEGYVVLPAQCDPKSVVRLVAARVLGPAFHEAYAAPELVVGEQLELFQCLPGSHR